MQKTFKRGLAMALALMVGSAAWAYSGEYYVTCNLNPNGDNWLALKSEPKISAHRIAKLGPGTFLRTSDPDPVGKWRHVSVVAAPNDLAEITGPSGWVHTDYICYIDMRQ